VAKGNLWRSRELCTPHRARRPGDREEPGGVWAYGVRANYTPGNQETWVDYTINDRSPLLFIGGSEDHIMLPAVDKSNAKRYAKSTALTANFDFEGRDHWTAGAPAGRPSPTRRSSRPGRTPRQRTCAPTPNNRLDGAGAAGRSDPLI